MKVYVNLCQSMTVYDSLWQSLTVHDNPTFLIIPNIQIRSKDRLIQLKLWERIRSQNPYVFWRLMVFWSMNWAVFELNLIDDFFFNKSSFFSIQVFPLKLLLVIFLGFPLYVIFKWLILSRFLFDREHICESGPNNLLK